MGQQSPAESASQHSDLEMEKEEEQIQIDTYNKQKDGEI
jgi:hypothetical protein